jgi:hypothetical protein
MRKVHSVSGFALDARNAGNLAIVSPSRADSTIREGARRDSITARKVSGYRSVGKL